MAVDNRWHERFAGDVDPLNPARRRNPPDDIDLNDASILNEHRRILDRWPAVAWDDTSTRQQHSGRLRGWPSRTRQGQNGGDN